MGRSGRGPSGPRDPSTSPLRGLLQNHSAAHRLQGCLDLLGLGLGHVGSDLLGQGFHQLLGLSESRVRNPAQAASTNLSQEGWPEGCGWQRWVVQQVEPHLDEVYALDVVLDFLDQLHLVHRLCLCQADGEM